MKHWWCFLRSSLKGIRQLHQSVCKLESCLQSPEFLFCSQHWILLQTNVVKTCLNIYVNGWYSMSVRWGQHVSLNKRLWWQIYQSSQSHKSSLDLSMQRSLMFMFLKDNWNLWLLSWSHNSSSSFANKMREWNAAVCVNMHTSWFGKKTSLNNLKVLPTL